MQALTPDSSPPVSRQTWKHKLFVLRMQRFLVRMKNTLSRALGVTGVRPEAESHPKSRFACLHEFAPLSMHEIVASGGGSSIKWKG